MRDVSISVTPIPNNTTKLFTLRPQQSIIAENEKQREKSLKLPKEKRDSFQRSKNKT